VQTLERERKLAGPAEALNALEGEPLDPRLFTSTYHDSGDRRLGRHGITLRRRLENGLSVWQLKLPREDGRLELEEPGGPGGVPERLAGLLVGVLRGAELEPAATLQTRRSGKRVSLRGGTVEAVLDEVTLLAGRRVEDRLTELELELVDGDPKALVTAERALVAAGAEAADQRPKVLRLLGAEDDAAGRPSAGAHAIDHVRARLEAQLLELLRHDPGTRVGDDPEDLHDLRVAVRRLRALLRAADSLLVPEWSEPLRNELKWLGGELGPARDLDVLLEHLRSEASQLERDEPAFADVLRHLEEERLGARERLLAALGSERYFALLDSLESAARAPHARALDAPLERLAAREFKKLAKAVSALGPDPSDDDLHRTRIRGKRARYAAELAQPVTGKRAARLVKQAKAFQDVVGEHQDAVIAEERLRALVPALATSDAVLAAGRAVERQRRRRRAARAALPAVWAKLARSGRAFSSS
jgi:CHAD domain-containing protein